MTEELTGKRAVTTYVDENRSGDHIWWISDVRKFQSHFPEWRYKYGIRELLEEIIRGFEGRI